MDASASGISVSGVAGQRLGPYHLVELIGRGGMAVVYKALQPALRRHVAVKALMPYFVEEEGFQARFQREAETVALLEHPNILPIFDFGQEGEIPYIVMPLIAGGTLREWLGQPVPFERALQVFSRILGALEYAHTRQPAIIHRDIKPTNILMGQEDWPLLADFGLAKIAESDRRVTRPGAMIGTPEYMSPEQCQGGPVDHRIDLYAMGIMLFKMLTGQVPYQGPSPMAVMIQQVNTAVPSPRSLNPELAPVWDEVIRRSLAKDPGDRYPSAQALDEAVQGAWRQAQRQSGQWYTVGMTDPDLLYELATRAVALRNWPRVIALCRQLLEVAPERAAAVQLLAQAQAALHAQPREAGSGTPETASVPLPGGPEAQQPAAPPAAPAPVGVLTVRQGAEPGRTYALGAGMVTLGRSADNHIPLDDGAVSRRHCQIRWAPDAYVVEDLGSTNGTHVNGAAVQVAQLRSGDLIQVGNLVLEFTLAQSALAGGAGGPDLDAPTDEAWIPAHNDHRRPQ